MTDRPTLAGGRASGPLELYDRAMAWDAWERAVARDRDRRRLMQQCEVIYVELSKLRVVRPDDNDWLLTLSEALMAAAWRGDLPEVGRLMKVIDRELEEPE